jgi:hypothetical protein
MTDAVEQPTAPSTVEGAQSRLAELTGSKDFGARLLNGDVAATREFKSVSLLAAGLEKRPGAEELSAISVKEADDRNAADFARSVRESVDVRPEVIRQAIYDETVTQAEHTEVGQWLKRHMADEAWTKRLLAGDRDARRDFFLASVTLSKEPK